MEELKLCESDHRFMQLIWEHEPVTSRRLVELAGEAFGWKKSTTYTVLKRLCERGIFQNNDGTVTSVISKQDFYAVQSEKFVEETFSGSLPAFLAAFTTRKKLSDAEINELQELINQSRG